MRSLATFWYLFIPDSLFHFDSLIFVVWFVLFSLHKRWPRKSGEIHFFCCLFSFVVFCCSFIICSLFKNYLMRWFVLLFYNISSILSIMNLERWKIKMSGYFSCSHIVKCSRNVWKLMADAVVLCAIWYI